MMTIAITNREESTEMLFTPNLKYLRTYSNRKLQAEWQTADYKTRLKMLTATGGLLTVGSLANSLAWSILRNEICFSTTWK